MQQGRGCCVYSQECVTADTVAARADQRGAGIRRRDGGAPRMASCATEGASARTAPFSRSHGQAEDSVLTHYHPVRFRALIRQPSGHHSLTSLIWMTGRVLV